MLDVCRFRSSVHLYQPLSPEIVEALIEEQLKLDGASPSLDVVVHPQNFHVQLTDCVCPDPLVMMNSLGKQLAALSGIAADQPPQRVSFSGGCADGEGPRWIGFLNVSEFADRGEDEAQSQAQGQEQNPAQGDGQGEGQGELRAAWKGAQPSGPSKPLPRPGIAASAQAVGPAPAPESDVCLRSPQDYELFLTHQSSWFTATVKANPRLHHFAKTTQRKRILDTAELLAQVLAPDEELLDVLPVRYRRSSCSLIVTNRRLWCACESLRLQRCSSQDLTIPLSELEQVEIAENGLRIQGQPLDHYIYFHGDESQNLEIILSYFTPVVRRPSIPETGGQRVTQALGVGLVASIVMGMGWTVAGFTDFFLRQVPLDSRPTSAISLDTGRVQTLNPNSNSSSNSDLNLSSNPNPHPNSKPSRPGTAILQPWAVTIPKQSEQQSCIDRLNGLMRPYGYAALNRATDTLLLHLEHWMGDYPSDFEFQHRAEQLADEVFSHCDRTTITQVRIEDGRFSFLKNRIASEEQAPRGRN